MSQSIEVFFDNAADAIIIAEKASGIILEANKAASHLLHMPHEKIVGMHQSKLHPQNDNSSFKNHVKDLDELGATVPHDEKIVRKDGSEIPVEILASQVVYDGKQCVMGIFRDISIRKQTEHDLIQSEDKFRNLLELAPEAFYHGNSEGKIIAVNEKAIELTEYTREELISMPLSKLFSQDTLSENPFRYDLLQRGETITRERKIITKTGNAVSVEMKSKMMPDGRLEWFMSDITERKKAEQALQKEKNLLRALIENMPYRIYVKDTESRFLLCNDSLAISAGYKSAEDIIGKTDFDLFPYEHAKQYYEDEQTLMALGKPLINHEEPRVYTGIEEVRFNLSHKIPWKDAAGQVIGLIGITSDITERKKAEKNLLQLNSKLTKLNATKDKLFSIIAHDLRSPLNNILGFSDLMTKKLQTSDIKTAKKYATVINSSAKNYLNLVDNLLTWAKTQTEEIKYTSKNLDLKPIVEESLMVLSSSASLKNIKLINSVSDDIVAFADPNMLQTIIRNLVQNAIKFTDSGGKVVITAVLNQDHIEISVSDNGVGITEENQKKLFGADLNFSMNGTENEGGTGLGLMLCIEFVEKHGGKIWVESQVGKGSSFLFTLPVSAKNSK